MHITHVNFAKGFRGGERQTLNLIQALAQQGCRQTLVGRPGSELMRRAQAETDAQLLPVAHPLLGHAGVPRTDLIHVHEARGAYWAWLQKCLHGTPYLITRRVINPISSGWLTRRVYAGAATLVGVSADVARRLQVQSGRQVEVVFDSCSPLAVDAARLSALRSQLGGGPVIGHVGVLHDAVKGQSTLIAAFRALCAEWPQARLLLVGDGPDQARLQAEAQGDGRIIFAGFQQDVGTWLAAIDVFAFPSHMEALGSSVLDAMTLGIPVVASDAGGLPELIGADERGLTVAGHDPQAWAAALRRVLGDAALGARLGAAGRVFAAQNDAAAMGQRYLRLYAAL